MNEEFSGGGQGAGARENKGWDHWEGIGGWERNPGRLMGVLKGEKAGEKGKNYPAMLKMCCTKQKWLVRRRN